MSLLSSPRIVATAPQTGRPPMSSCRSANSGNAP